MTDLSASQYRDLQFEGHKDPSLRFEMHYARLVYASLVASARKLRMTVRTPGIARIDRYNAGL